MVAVSDFWLHKSTDAIWCGVSKYYLLK